MTELDDEVVAEFRANAGVVVDAMGGHFKNIHLLLPAWVANVAAMPEVAIDVGEQTLRRSPRSCGRARNGTACTRRRWPTGPTSSNTRPTPRAPSRSSSWTRSRIRPDRGEWVRADHGRVTTSFSKSIVSAD